MRVLSFDMGTRNMAFALVEDETTVLRMGCVDLGSNSSRNASEVLLDSLRDPDDNGWMAGCCDEIVVELQPTNGACKILSFVLMTYFRLYDEFRSREVRPFRFMPAGFKLKYNPELYAEHAPTTYNGRKDVAVAMAYEILGKNEAKFIEFFRGQNPKRKTDLADAIVQAAQHFKCPDLQSKKSRKRQRTTTNGPSVNPEGGPQGV
jgi:hypothetical protein